MDMFWPWKKRSKRTIHPDAPAFWQSYEALTLELPAADTAIAEVPFVVLDTETSGLEVERSHILSIGAIRVKNWTIAVADRLECHLDTGTVDVADSAAVHEILPQQQTNNPRAAEVLPRLIDFIGNSTIVGHHINFDRAMLDKALKEINGGYPLQNYVLDTMTLARRVFAAGPHHIPKPWSLDELSSALHVPVYQRHTAGGDAFITALVFLKLLARLEKRGVKTLGDLRRSKSKW